MTEEVKMSLLYTLLSCQEKYKGQTNQTKQYNIGHHKLLVSHAIFSAKGYLSKPHAITLMMGFRLVVGQLNNVTPIQLDDASGWFPVARLAVSGEPICLTIPSANPLTNLQLSGCHKPWPQLVARDRGCAFSGHRI